MITASLSKIVDNTGEHFSDFDPGANNLYGKDQAFGCHCGEAE